MKNIFQKIFKSVSSHLFFLLLGLCLAVGVTIAYASWSTALTGGSGKLSEANWNALVTQLQINRTSGVSAISAETGSTYTHAAAAAYCYGLSAVAAYAMDGDTSTTYTDWRLPTVSEGAVFESTITSTNYIWTATVRDANYGYWIILRLSDGDWNATSYTYSQYVRCVR